MTDRVWRALCPNCGAPVEFRSAASASAVCSYCQSTLVRDGETLRRIGRAAEIFDDFSPLALGASGRFQGESFLLVGRLQFGTDEGPWNEWHAVFDNGRDGWLSEDNGRYVFAFDAPPPPDVPRPQGLRPGQPGTIGGRPWTVASVVAARVLAAEGELLAPPPPGDRTYPVVDLRNPQGEVATLAEFAPDTPSWSIGQAVALSELQMSGLKAEAGKTLASKAFACPSCGASLALQLSTTQSLVCPQCKAVVDVSQGIGGDLAYYAQQNTRAPQIPLGRVGALPPAAGQAPVPWTVVGYVERIELGEDESEAWREYLLWNRLEGFAFLVDANEGWSFVRTLTGTPTQRGERAIWMDTTYQRRWQYASQVTYVLGEFYWKVERDQRTQHQDYAGVVAGRQVSLSREETPAEVTWSAGEEVDPALLVQVFALQGDDVPQAAAASGPPPPNARVVFWLVLIVLLVIVVVALSHCSSGGRGYASGGYYGGSGGSYGGYSSSGGGHK